jgi:peptidoglycan/LPS O-acetylase OafA/YrhL
MVFVFHVWFFALAVPGQPTGLPIADAILGHLWVGLTFFFVLSGFLLYRPFAAAALAGSPPPRVARYALARAIRIIPAYWFALLFAPALLGLHVTGWQLLANLAFLQTYLAHGVVVIGPSWTLCIEASFYLVMPLVALAGARAARRSPRRLLTALSPLVVLGISCRAGITLHGVEKLPETIDLFAVGMMTAVIVEAGWGRRWMPLLAFRPSRSQSRFIMTAPVLLREIRHGRRSSTRLSRQDSAAS